MSMSTGWRRRAVALAGLACLLAALLPGVARAASDARPALTAEPPDAVTLALRQGRLSEAQYALERARALFDLQGVRARYGRVAAPDPRSATLVLRDLVVRFDELSAADQQAAKRLLARPTAGFGERWPAAARPDDPTSGEDILYPPEGLAAYFYTCPAQFCVNWVQASTQAPSLSDLDGNGRSDFVDAVIQTMTEVWNAEIVQLGFRPPKSDLDSPDPFHFNVNGLTDIYITDLGSLGGLFGYCTTDDPKAFDPNYPGLDASAYCVIDNDYSPQQYGDEGGLRGLRATLAHEFFHAIQYAYNLFQDDWLLEGAAAWMEDNVYDEADTPFIYLLPSPVVNPNIPLDLDDKRSDSVLSNFKYGTFTFLQYLTETFDPGLMRQIFEAGDGIPGKEPAWAVDAVDIALQSRTSSFRSAFADFGVAIIAPSLFFEEGANWFVPDKLGNPVPAEAPLPKAATLTARKKTIGPKAVVMDHLTNVFRVFRPGAGVLGKAKLRVTLDLPEWDTGPEATLVVVARNGSISSIRPFRLNNAGDGTLTVPFGKVRSIILVLTNASNRFVDCTLQTFEVNVTCHGTPLDDDVPYLYTARLVQ
jgi:hypothetical protein